MRRPDLLTDVRYPRNPLVQIQGLIERLDHLERYYGSIVRHRDLDELVSDSQGNIKDDHQQYALSVSVSDRRAREAATISGSTPQTGEATVYSGQNNVAVIHKLGSLKRVYLTPTTTTQGIGYHVSTKTDTGFIIQLDSTPTINVVFDWIAYSKDI